MTPTGTMSPQCALCGVGHRRPGVTTITLDRDGVTIVFRKVPAEVCDTCGEAIVDTAIARELERAGAVAMAEGVRYEVRDYVAKVA